MCKVFVWLLDGVRDKMVVGWKDFAVKNFRRLQWSGPGVLFSDYLRLSWVGFKVIPDGGFTS